jgi:hypothetical protein
LLIGIRGHARSMVDAASPPGFPRGRAHFFEDPAEAGEFARRRRTRAMRFSSRVPAACTWSGRWKGFWPNSMLYYLLYEQLYRYASPLRVFRYTTFRTAFASLTALFLCIALGPWLINKLREFQIGQYIREEGPKSHQKKAGTPTMGGVLIIISIVIPTLLWADLRYPYVWIAIAGLLGYGWIGFLDDYAKVTRQRNLDSDGKAQAGVPVRHGVRIRRRSCW